MGATQSCMPPGASARDLDGVLVVSIEQAVAAPYASRRLADAGARVIKIERPEGDFARGYDRLVRGQSAYFVWLNGGKESVCLDLRATADLELLSRLIARADVFLHNLKPGALERLGLGAEVRRSRYPGLVDCEITGFGTDGPFAHLKAYDLIVQGESGLCDITGDGPMRTRVAISPCDLAAGMNAHAAILQALYARERTGRGRHIRISLLDSIGDWMNVAFLQFRYGGRPPPRAGIHHPSITPYGAYECGDGHSVILSVQNEREWRAFCADVLADAALAHRPEFADVSARVKHRRALDDIIERVFRGLTLEEAMARLEQAGIAYGRLNSIETASAHPHLRHFDVATPGGDIRVVAPAPVTEPADRIGPVPALGAHTDAVRAEFR